MTYQEDLRVTAEEAERANAVKTDFLKRMSMISVLRLTESEAGKCR